jgi:CTD small phosphatase-like protein 2
VKDLSRIGRDLSRTVIVDNVAENFTLQKDNGIFIKTWFNDGSDTAFEQLSELLSTLVIKGVSDVRTALRSFRDQMLRLIAAGDSPKPHLLLKEARKATRFEKSPDKTQSHMKTPIDMELDRFNA